MLKGNNFIYLSRADELWRENWEVLLSVASPQTQPLLTVNLKGELNVKRHHSHY